MDRFRKTYLQHFVEYNMCYGSAKLVYNLRYIAVAAASFVVVVLIYVDDASVFCQEVKGFNNIKLTFIIVAAIYSLAVIFLPMWHKKRNRYDEMEELVIFNCISYFTFAPGVVFMALVVFIYMTHGVIMFFLALLFVIVSVGVASFGSKRFIKKLIRKDAFNKKKDNPAFSMFDSYNRWMIDSAWFTAVGMGMMLFVRGSSIGVMVAGFYFASLPAVMINAPVCYLLQIKYAREYGLQEYLPTKSVEEIEKEEGKEEHRDKSSKKQTNKTEENSFKEKEGNADDTLQQLGSVDSKYNFGKKWSK